MRKLSLSLLEHLNKIRNRYKETAKMFSGAVYEKQKDAHTQGTTVYCLNLAVNTHPIIIMWTITYPKFVIQI